jgi:hypothetical protein
MAMTFYLSNLTANLTGGVRYNNRLVDTVATAASITIPVTNSTTEDSYGYTDAGVPDSTTDTPIGNYSVLVNVTTGTTDIFCQIGLTRVNSSGVAQTNSTFTAEQGMTAGQKTFNLTSVNLGTWTTGDRLRVNYRFRSSRAHGGPSQIIIQVNTSNAAVNTPWTLAAQNYERNYQETAVASDIPSISPSIVKSDSFDVSDSAIFTPFLNKSETVATSESYVSDVEIVKIEITDIVDVFLSNLSTARTESVSTSEVFEAHLYTSYNETPEELITISDFFNYELILGETGSPRDFFKFMIG